MKILSKKLQVRILCQCGNKFVRVYNDGQINSRDESNQTVKFIYARCPKCQAIEDVTLYQQLKNNEQS